MWKGLFVARYSVFETQHLKGFSYLLEETLTDGPADQVCRQRLCQTFISAAPQNVAATSFEFEAVQFD